MALRFVDRVLEEEGFDLFDSSVVGLSEIKEEVEGLADSLLSEQRIFLALNYDQDSVLSKFVDKNTLKFFCVLL